MNIELLYAKYLLAKNGISTDTRMSVQDTLFFAWRGESLNGNKYAQEALEKGALYVVLDDEEYFDKTDDRYILVEDSMHTLSMLAQHHRRQFDIPIIALTGSNGKTTTKELISATLSTEKRVVSTEGNLNNHVGVPKTLLEITDQTEIAIVEMGANHVGEIAALSSIAEPTHGIITNIGRAHLGLFGGFDGVVRTKTELYRFLENNKGASFVNGEDELLLEQSNTDEKITYLSTDSNYPLVSEKTSPFVSVKWKDHLIKTKLTGEYNVPNIAVAIAVADYFGVSEQKVIAGIKAYTPSNERSEIVEIGTNTVIKDYYNANRSSMELALENFKNIKTTKGKIAVLGDMFELGEYSKEEHRAVLEKAIVGDCKELILVGEHFGVLENDYASFSGEPKIRFFKTTDGFISEFNDVNFENKYVLLKASQGMNFRKFFIKKFSI